MTSQTMDFQAIWQSFQGSITQWLDKNPEWWLGLLVAAVAFAALFLLRMGLVAITSIGRDKAQAGLRLAVRKAAIHTSTLFLLALSVSVGLRFVQLPDNATKALNVFVLLIIVYQVAVWAVQILNSWFDLYTRRRGDADPTLGTASSLIRTFIRVGVWIIALLFILDNLGINVTSLVAGLGIGGIAIGFAAQGIIGDLFASLSIVFDKPFITGDFIIFDDQMGTVERVGLKTTRIRSLSGEQIVVANADLLKTRIRNYKRLQERRVLFRLGLVYQTPPEKLTRTKAIITEVIQSIDRTRLDRCHFASYGNFSLDFEIVYYVLSAEYNDYMDIQEKINLEIYRRFAAEGMEFAYPTQTIQLGKAE